jgi:L-amino acid N-acyltransferase YncA
MGYHYTIEDSVFVYPDNQQRGIGKALLGALIEECRRIKYRTMVAVFGAGRDVLPGTFKLHVSFGFKEVGRLIGVGEKFGKTLDTPILQLDLRRDTQTTIPLLFPSHLTYSQRKKRPLNTNTHTHIPPY